MFQETMEELQNENDQLKGLFSSKKLKWGNPFGGRSTPVVDGVGIADISVDDPPMMSPVKNEEVIGDNVILDLKENISR